MRYSKAVILLATSLAAGCGGGKTPTQPGTPTPGAPVNGFVFYDENANGLLDPSETVRLPGVTVAIGAEAGTSVAGGRFAIGNAPLGAQTLSLRPETLPSYFGAGVAQSITVPPAGEVAVPATLALGSRARPNLYMAFGDSITCGDGSTDGNGYRAWLQNDLRTTWGKADVLADCDSGTKSIKGLPRLAGSLATHRPAFLLILYGTNDYNDAECRDARFPCYTIDTLRTMVSQTRGFGAQPVLGTIPPVNPAWADRYPAARNDWVKRMNDQIRVMAREQHVSIAEIYGDFMKQPSLPPLFSDEKHPNDAGYRLIARSFGDAITKPYGATASRRRFGSFGWPFGD